jgi:hypothetical protein
VLLFIQLILFHKIGDKKLKGIQWIISTKKVTIFICSIWISPICPKTTGDTESKTNFKKDLLEYIERYRARQLQFWHKTIDEHDFSSVK